MKEQDQKTGKLVWLPSLDVSNFSRLKHALFEPLQLLLDQWHPRKPGTRIQTGPIRDYSRTTREPASSNRQSTTGIGTVNATAFWG